ncbi:ABC transporter substrate-binding protein [Novosphingobium sp.]|uniref:ABC transporter substrate-binding protein n=1 Tax=Novosphingobium sp. TaxID=1874826 RepID=UPI0028B09D9C|nr:ABC transporter substrate-binding protein [Novosphingobium sp.]
MGDVGKLDRIWLVRSPIPAASSIAWSLGWLDEEFAPDGIAVEWIREDRLRVAEPDHAVKARNLFREGGNIPALAARALGTETRVIGLTWIDERQAIMVRPGEEIFDPRQLRGLRFALPGYVSTRGASVVRGMSLHGIKNALRLAGLTLEDVHFVDVPTPQVDFSEPQIMQRMWSGLPALVDGRVDAVYVKGAAAAEAAQKLGLVVGIDLDAYPSRMTRVNNGTPRPIVTHRRMIEEHFDVVVRFLLCSLRAADWAARHPAQLRHILERETFSGPAGVEAAYRDGFHRALHPDLSPDRIDMLRAQEQFLRLYGFLESAVDIDGWIDARPLAAALALRANDRAA